MSVLLSVVQVQVAHGHGRVATAEGHGQTEPPHIVNGVRVRLLHEPQVALAQEPAVVPHDQRRCQKGCLRLRSQSGVGDGGVQLGLEDGSRDGEADYSSDEAPELDVSWRSTLQLLTLNTLVACGVRCGFL